MQRVLPVVVLALALVLVTAPRFDQRDVGPIGALTGTEDAGNLGDAQYYVQYVEALRDEAVDLPPAPFRYRPLTPLLAAPLPVGPLTAINIVNLIALGVASLGLWSTLRALALSPRRCDLGCLLFIVSFPTAYYGTIGYVEPVAIALLMLGVWAVLTDRHPLVLGLLVLGALARENTAVLAVVGVVWLASQGRTRRSVGWSVLWCAAFVSTALAVRAVLYAPGVNLWQPSLDQAMFNLRRPRTWLSAALTLGVPTAIIVARLPELRRVRRDRLVFFGTGVVLSIGVFAYALTSAYADGRFLWPIYAFTVPLAMSVTWTPLGVGGGADGGAGVGRAER